MSSETRRVPLNVHVSTDELTGEVKVSFSPVNMGGMGAIPTRDWSGLGGVGIRDELRQRVRAQIDERAFKSYLDSNRLGERFEATLGTLTLQLTVSDDETVSEWSVTGESLSTDIEGFDWESV